MIGANVTGVAPAAATINAIKIAVTATSEVVTRSLGDRVATLAWNTGRHMEAWYGIMGIGAVCHTVNPRLFPDQIAWIINHAEDRIIFVDLTFVPLLEKILDKMPSVERYVVFTDKATTCRRPRCRTRRALRRLDRGSPRRRRLGRVRREHRLRPVLHLRHDRRPQGRALFAPLQRAPHAGGQCRATRSAPAPAIRCCRSCRCSTPMPGASPSRPGHGRQAGHAGRQDGRRLDLRTARHREGDLLTAAVPTVWLMLLQHMAAEPASCPTSRVVIGGSAMPRSMIKRSPSI
jgi:fatty-acyl-CoA synthase